MNKTKDSKYKTEACGHCGTFWDRSTTVDSIVLDKNGDVYLIKRGNEPAKGAWAMPGGFLDWDETLEEAAARELKEELNLTAKNVKFFGTYSDPARMENQNIAVVFTIEADGVPRAGDDAVDFKAFSLDELPENLAFDHRKILEEFRGKKAD